MRLIDRKTLKAFYDVHPDSEAVLDQWYQAMKFSSFQNLEEVRKTFPHADSVGRITVFNIKGNKYRLLTAIHYNKQIVYILEILTHAQYSKNTWKQTFKAYS